MKKIIVAISGLLLIAFVVIKVANAQSTPQDVKKASTEQKMDCGKCPSTEACAQKADSKTSEVKSNDPAKCKEGKSDSTKCKAKITTAKDEMKNCDTTKCKGMVKK